MTGKAYTPSGFEPDAHGRFNGPNEEVIALQRRLPRGGPQRVNYKEIQEYSKRGRLDLLGHYAYEMMYDIYVGIEDKVFEGAIDTHLHIFPDYVPRVIDIIELAIEASKAKMGAIVCKDHFFSNVGQAWAAQWVVDEMVRKGELEHACKVFGTYNLAWSYHPDQVNLIRKYPNLGAIFFPTMTGGGTRAGIEMPVIDDKGDLLPEVKECIRIAGENRICIMTGHVGMGPGGARDQRTALVEYAREVGTRILVTHAGGATLQTSDVEQQIKRSKEWAKLGAYLEVNGNSMLPNMMHPACDPNAAFDYMRELGPEHCVANTDFGQPTCEDPVDGFKRYVRCMIHFGFSEEEIKLMIRTNPAKLLYLED